VSLTAWDRGFVLGMFQMGCVQGWDRVHVRLWGLPKGYPYLRRIHLLQRMHNHWPGGSWDAERGWMKFFIGVRLCEVGWGVMDSAWRGLTWGQS